MSEGGSVQVAHDRPSKETPRRMAENYKLLATEVFRQATGVMSEGGSVCQIHDWPSEETLGRMAENCKLLATEIFC